MKRSKFATYNEDRSTIEYAKDLYGHKRSILVKSMSSRLVHRPDNMTVVDMRDEVLELALSMHVKNMSYCFELTDANRNNMKKIPTTTLIAAILHPLFPVVRMIGSLLLSQEQ